MYKVNKFLILTERKKQDPPPQMQVKPGAEQCQQGEVE